MKYLHCRHRQKGNRMLTRVRKWGNSLALRIPGSLASEAQIVENRLVELTLLDGKLVLTPVEDGPPSLEELLARVTPENLHGEVAAGRAVGSEAW